MDYLDTPVAAHTRGARLGQRSAVWKDFLKDFDQYLRIPGMTVPAHVEAGHCFAVFFQIQRAFNHIFECIIGRSIPIARLRAAVWESIFTHDMSRDSRGLQIEMNSLSTTCR